MSTSTAHAALERRTPEDPAGLLGHVEILSSLKPQSLERVAKLCEWKPYAAHETVFAAGQYDAREVLLILKGAVRACAPVAGTGEMRIQEFHEGDAFGAAFALSSESADCERIDMVALEDTQVASIHAEAFRSLLSRHPSVALAILDLFAEQLSSGETGLASPKAPLRPESRIYAELLQIASPDPTAMSGWRIEKMPKHRDLAEHAGSTETGAAAAVAKLIREGVVKRSYPGLEILDYERLGAFARMAAKSIDDQQ